MKPRKSLARFLATGVFAAFMLQGAAAFAASSGAPNDPPDLGATPPDLNQSVDPNIIVTFDDSGSMTSTYMGDGRPYDGKGTVTSSWAGPWACANVINPNIAKSSSYYDIASKPMNGVYYNPNITYTPPLYEDGSSFPNADATLKAVWQDGIAINRPTNKATAGTAAYSNNPNGSAGANSGARTDLTGQYTVTNTTNVADLYGGSCPASADTGSCSKIISAGTNTTGCPTAPDGSNAYNCTRTCILNSRGRCSGTYNYSWSDTYHWTVTTTTTTTTDKRWMCGSVNTTTNWKVNADQNPFDGTATYADPDTGATPNGGPVYWRFKSSALSSLALDSTTGQLTAAAKTALYTASNWEAVSVPASQYQNFANWYAYYRYRNLMARTALSRVFGVIGTPTHANVRVLWQNINSSTYGGGSGSTTGLNGKAITNLDDSSTDPYGTTAKYRAAFFNWVFNTGANGSTPTRTAAIRAGNYLCNGLNADCNGSVSTSVNSTLNPYWSPSATSTSGVQLSCRQNFHMMMTDGLYNQPAVSVTGNGSNASSTTAINLPAGFLTTSDPSTYVGVASNTKSPTTIFGHSGWTNDSDTGSSYSDISFYYWVNNLNKQLTDANAKATPVVKDFVPAYFPDQTTGVTDTAATVDPKDPGATPELFWNPANDPAQWPHLVQFAVTLGAFGNLTYSDDMDCNKNTNGLGKGKNDLCYLRTGQTTSRGAVGWPQPNGAGSGIDANIDDLWHAALNSRGAFFVATDPSSLVQHLTAIIQSVAARTQASTSESVSTSILNQGTFGYTGGYDSGSWTGYLYKLALDATTAIATAADWDAGCIMTGGTFTPIAPTSDTAPRGDCKVSTPPPTPPSRIIFTSKKSGTTLVGVPFQWASLGSTEQGYLNLDPTTTDVDGSTGQVITTASSTAPATNDGNGTDRVDYLRGKRDNETSPTSETLARQFRIRKSLLGPVINSQVMYEAGPSSGLQDIFPVGSAEQAAAAPCTGTGGLTATGCNSYEKFVKDNINRTPLIYVGANDGMLHAFDADTGSEVWAYVPNMLYGNGQLDQTTNPSNTLTTTVDDTPIISDVFFPANSTDPTKGGTWHTILVGGMRLGGRGIYALDITDQGTPASESDAAGKFLWEFTNANDSDLGYTYASTNIARLHNGRWVVLLTSGYFPQQLQVQSATYGQNLTPDTAAAAKAGVTHMWVLDAQTGAVIRKIDTPSTVTSYGLSTPNVVDFGLDQVGDVSIAGDLAGNLWRFDLSSTDSTKWSVEAMFKTYDNTSACSTSNKTGIGCEPITVQPQAFADPATGSVIYVFGSGEYLGPSDRTASSVIGTNHFFGVRDYGTGSSKYPLHESDLVSQTLTQDTAGIRYLTSSSVPTTKAGWMIPLNISTVKGERAVVKATPLFSAGIAVLTSLIPGANNDPCTPGRVGAVMAVNASTGGPVNPSSTSGGAVAVGAEVTNPPATGGSAVISPIGGGSVIIPGVGIIGSGANSSFSINGGLPIWRRTSWRELLNNL
jgi:type IV pilus assembly protein PilY1